ncbi:MAG: YraN family protein [Rhodospirillales bacterium]|jgi:putative endonuclease|nr:YraN family protein [Rhodospirillales bacterium]
MRPGARRATADRRRAWRYGWLGEGLAAALLVAKGYRVLARRWRTAAGEIDIVARRRGVLAFVEVKARRDAASAIAAVGPRQRRRIERAAAAFIGRRPELAGLDWRFDVMLVTPWGLPRHLKSAWRPE